MLTEFGQFCRKLRIDRGELLFHMASKLGVSSAFLSSVENGKKNPPKEWQETICELYGLKSDDKQKLKELFLIDK